MRVWDEMAAAVAEGLGVGGWKGVASEESEEMVGAAGVRPLTWAGGSANAWVASGGRSRSGARKRRPAWLRRGCGVAVAAERRADAGAWASGPAKPTTALL